jgi:hypothetical protein
MTEYKCKRCGAPTRPNADGDTRYDPPSGPKAIPAANDLLPMEAAPRDGTTIILRVEHENYQYASAPERRRWIQFVEAKWIDHNGGGFTWEGLAGRETGWIPKPARHYMDT